MKAASTRRNLLKGSALASAGAALATPAIAQTLPSLSWRLTSSFPKSLDLMFGVSEHFARRVTELTEGRFKIQVFAAGEIVGGMQAIDVVQTNAVEMCHTASFYFIGKDPAFAMATGIPWGLNTRQYNAWLYLRKGIEQTNEFFAGHGLYGLPCGATGAQMGGWFRKEIKSIEDLKGLKFRIGGLAGNVMQKLGVIPAQLAPGDIYPSLERGTLDAVEYIGPYDDEKLGFYKVAPYYYYPGFWDSNSHTTLFINKDRWTELPPLYKAVIETCAAEANNLLLARYDAQNPAALRRLVAAGAQLRPFPRDIIEASFKAAQELYGELGQRSPAFAKMYADLVNFRTESAPWMRISELAFDSLNLNLNLSAK
jgi:TRAP-type mannitol/chloroaromatic compound transport system substrate-binding protein